jgi:hypothetical protein
MVRREPQSTRWKEPRDEQVDEHEQPATAIRETSDKLKGVGPLGAVAGRAADGIESVAEFFEGKQIGDVVREVEKFACREPALFVGAAFALGLIGGRFLKSSHRSGATGAGGQYARSGAGSFERYEGSYGASSFGASTGSGSASDTTTKTASPPPTPGTSSTSPS